MNILKEIGRRVDALVEGTYRLIGRSRRGELPVTRVDPGEDLGPCVHCGDDVVRTDGVRFDTGAVHTACESATNRDRANTLACYRIYCDTVRSLKGLGDERVTVVVLDVGQRIRSPASRQQLADRLKEISDRVSSDARIHTPNKDAVKAITANARTAIQTSAAVN